MHGNRSQKTVKKIKFGARKTSVADSRMVRIMAVLAVVALGVAGVITSANITDNASAANTGDIDFNLSIQDSLGLTVSANTISVTLDPGSNPFSKSNLTTTVGTNNENGYTLTMSATGTDLVESSDSSLTIPTLSSAVDEDAFKALTDSRWGYKNSKSGVSTTNYLPFASGVTISESETAVNADVANLVFATHVGYATAPGTYELSLNFTATATPGYIDISQAEYMQDVSSVAESGCPNTLTTGQAYGLKDRRDTHTYYVARLEDGKCWMLQNLRLGDDTTSVALTDEYSDVPSGGFTLNGKLSDGKFTYTTVGGTNYQNNSSQYYCTSNYGCYYNWYTATASSGTTYVETQGTNVDYSICPAGWTLPTQAEWAALNTAYGSSATNLLVANPTSTTENTNGAYAPGLLLGGNYNSSGAYAVGSSGSYWSRTAYSAQSGYYMYLNTSSVYPALNVTKYLGLTVRCVLK